MDCNRSRTGLWTATEAEQAFGLRPEEGHL